MGVQPARSYAAGVERPPVIGLVGGIGAGKSAVAAHLRRLGCVVCDSDALAREVLLDPGVRRELVRWWGSGIMNSDGLVDRRRVAAIVFERPEERLRLEALIHPLVERRREALFRDAPASTRALVIDAPLLLEAGLGERCDAILFVDAPEAMRRARVEATRGWDAAELARREAAQWPLDRKRAAARAVIRNDGSEAELARAVEAALADVLA